MRILTITFLFCLNFLFLNCNIEIRRTSLNFENKSFDKISNQKIRLRNIEYPQTDTKEIMEVTFKANLKRTLVKNGFFRDVDYYQEPLDKEAFILDIKFLKNYEDISIHPLYFPGSILTLTLYIWLGGPIGINKVEDEVSVSVFNPKGVLVSQVSKSLNYKENENIYSVFRNYKDRRSELILNAIKEAFQK